MRKTIPLILATLAVAAAPTALSARDKLTGEQELAKKLAGRVAGKPQSCLDYTATQTMEVIDKTAIVFGWGDTIWVNRPRNAADLDSDNVLVHKSNQSEWCKLDIVHALSRPGMWFRGTVDLGDFIPYTKVKPQPVKTSG
jgi:hypothetical protein